ncbi:MAG: hypothetical protein HC890_16510, partial [Chloroflexaceae bacterium]|nr:hypothetical protein [Chloroflexaceae bacterium]
WTDAAAGYSNQSCGDHRIAMSLAIAALSATGTTIIHGAEAAAISYPDFNLTLQQLCNPEGSSVAPLWGDAMAQT